MSADWELSKENVQPVKRGRSVNVLGERLAVVKPTAELESINKKQEESFEQMICKAKENAVSVSVTGIDVDPNQTPGLLEVYLLYFKWVRDTFPSSSDKALHVLEAATCDMKDDVKLKNDIRFIKLWIEYADMVRAPGDIFSFMQSNKIGEKVSLFWIAWAFVAEKVNNFKLTDQIFTKGLKKQAEPRELLQKRYQQFQRRMARHLINTQEEEADRAAATAGTANNMNLNDRQALNKLSKSRGTGALRTGSAISTVQGNGLPISVGENSNSRSGNGNGHSNTHGGRESISQALRASAPVSISSISSTTTSGCSSSSGRASALGMGNFQIFSDSDPIGSNTSAAAPAGIGAQIFCDDAPALAENAQWSKLGKQTSQIKENAAPVTTWSSGGLPGPTSSSSSSSSSRTSTQYTQAPIFAQAPLAFSIFEDEDVPASTSAPPVTSATSYNPSSSSSSSSSLSVSHVDQCILATRDKKDVYDPIAHLRKERDIARDTPKPVAATVPTSDPTLLPLSVFSRAVMPLSPVHTAHSNTAGAASRTGSVEAAHFFRQEDQDEEDSADRVIEGLWNNANNAHPVSVSISAASSPPPAAVCAFDLDAMDAMDGTINTRLAMGAINSMFSSPKTEKKNNNSSSSSDKGMFRSNTSNSSTQLAPASFPMSHDLSMIRESSADHSVFNMNMNTPTVTMDHTKGGCYPHGVGTGTTGKGGVGFTIFED